MKAFSMLGVTFFVMTSAAFAATDSGEVVADSSYLNIQTSQAVKGVAVLPNGIYTVSEATPVVPRGYVLNGQLKPNIDNAIKIRPGDKFSIRTEGDNVYLTTVVADEVSDKYPSVYIFSNRDLADVKFSFISPGDQYDLYKKFSPYKETDYARWCKRNSEAAGHFHFSGLCTTDIPESEITAKGFSQVNCDSGLAGVIMWSGGHAVPGHRSNCGHMAYTSSMTRRNGRLPGQPGERRYHYELRGCYARAGGGFSWGSAQKAYRSGRLGHSKRKHRRN
jgi:hypothetical protein